MRYIFSADIVSFLSNRRIMSRSSKSSVVTGQAMVTGAWSDQNEKVYTNVHENICTDIWMSDLASSNSCHTIT